MKFRVNALTDRGLVRDDNEDSLLISSHLVAIADGMGGHAAGEIASKIAITNLATLAPLLSDTSIDKDSREDLLLNITYEIDNQILVATREKSEYSGMGTTLTAIHINNDGEDSAAIELLHIGDSRCYKFTKKKLEQLSYDHTVMQELLDQGRLSPEDIAKHPQRSLLTQALMGDSGIDPILMVYPTKVGENFLLCSDGLTNVLSDSEIEKILAKTTYEEIPSVLIRAVKEKGAPDNISVIWVEVIDDEGEETSISLLGAARG